MMFERAGFAHEIGSEIAIHLGGLVLRPAYLFAVPEREPRSSIGPTIYGHCNLASPFIYVVTIPRVTKLNVTFVTLGALTPPV